MILIENKKCAADVILDLQPFVESHTKPIEQLVSGLRIKIASIQAQLGDKDLSRKDTPPVLWNAVEAGFDSFLDLDTKLSDIDIVANEAHEVAGELLSGVEVNASKNQVQFENPPPEIDKEIFLNNLSGPHIINGQLYHPPNTNKTKFGDATNYSNGNDFNSNVNGAFNNGGNTPFNRDNVNGFNNGNLPPDPSGDPNGNPTINFNEDDLLCGRCMVRFHTLKTSLGATNVRVSNLEDTKNRNIDSAIMVKYRIYRGRGDIDAELENWFTAAQSKQIDAGLLPTPSLILNLMHADIFSKKAPEIPLGQKDLIKL